MEEDRKMIKANVSGFLHSLSI